MIRRLWALFRRDGITDEIREEFDFHLAMRIDEWERRGYSRAEAERLARRRFGNVVRLRDEGYDVRGAGLLESVWQDVRQSVRLWRQRRSTAAGVVATMALGAALVAVLTSLVDAAWLRPLPFVNADRLVTVSLRIDAGGRESGLNPSAREVAALQGATPAVAAIGAYHPFEERLVLDAGEPERVPSLTATPGYFEAHRAQPVVGRTFTADDTRPGAEAVIILGYGAWQMRFAADPAVVGRRVLVDGSPVTVIGVAPRGFHRSAFFWRPMPMGDDRADRRGSGAEVVARLADGVGLEHAREALATIARTWSVTPQADRVEDVALDFVYDDLVARTRDSLTLITAAITVLVLLVGVNVAGLLSAEGASRRQELAVRAVLGAGRGRLVRQQLTAASVLAVAAGVVGCWVAWVTLDWLVALMPLQLPPHAAPALNWRVLAVTLSVVVLASWVVASGPAWRQSRLNLREWIDGRIPDLGRRRFWRPGQLVVAAQVGVAVVLMAACGLLVRSLDRLLRVDLGFAPESAYVLDVSPIDPSPAVWQHFYPALVERLKAMPGIDAAGATDWVPMAPVMAFLAMPVEGGPELSPAGVTPGALEALGVTLRSGRLLRDTDAGRPVAVLTESAAREAFGTTDVVGRPLNLGPPMPESMAIPPLEVIGVVADVKGFGPRQDAQNLVFTELMPHSFMPPSIVLRSRGAPPDLPQLRALAATVGPRVVVERVRPATTLLDDNITLPRARTTLLALLAATGLLLSLVGVTAVTTHAVVRRTREIGVRLAMGATPLGVVRTVALGTLVPAAAGLAGGLAVALYAGAALEAYLFEVPPVDIVSLTGVCLVMCLCASLVAWLPALRAARIDPVQALRQ